MYEHITIDSNLQGLFDNTTGEFLGEVLRDEKFPWKERKLKTLTLADIYNAAGFPDYADRAKNCSTWLQYLADGKGARRLRRFNACQLRLCSLCSTRRAKQIAHRLSKVLNYVESQHNDVAFVFLTLTVRNCDGSQLRATIDLLMDAFHKLFRQRPVARVAKGWFRALEITRNAKDGTYHPHFHVIVAVEPDYFKRSSGLYITQQDWVARWQRCLKVQYKPLVSIQATKARPGRPAAKTKSKAMAAVAEAAKYTTKDCEYINDGMSLAEAAGVVSTYTNALRGRRLVAMGGWFKEAAAALDIEELEDGDLVHLDDEDELREDIAELLEVYGWHFGGKDYILRSREANPNRIVADAVACQG